MSSIDKDKKNNNIQNKYKILINFNLLPIHKKFLKNFKNKLKIKNMSKIKIIFKSKINSTNKNKINNFKIRNL